MGAESERDRLRWAEALAGVARTGLAFTESLYERERFEEVLRIAADIRATCGDAPGPDELVEEWMRQVEPGIGGYVTPKVAVGAIVLNPAGEVLLVRRSDTGQWLYPTGWAEVGYSPSEVVVREVLEETGIRCRPERLLAVVDALRAGYTRVPFHSLVFACSSTGGTIAAHPLETMDAGWFPLTSLPDPLAGEGRWVSLVERAGDPSAAAAFFDEPRDPVWQG